MARKKAAPKQVWFSKTVGFAMAMEALVLFQANTETFTSIMGVDFYKAVAAMIPFAMIYLRFISSGQVTLRKPTDETE